MRSVNLVGATPVDTLTQSRAPSLRMPLSLRDVPVSPHQLPRLGAAEPKVLVSAPARLAEGVHRSKFAIGGAAGRPTLGHTIITPRPGTVTIDLLRPVTQAADQAAMEYRGGLMSRTHPTLSSNAISSTLSGIPAPPSSTRVTPRPPRQQRVPAPPMPGTPPGQSVSAIRMNLKAQIETEISATKAQQEAEKARKEAEAAVNLKAQKEAALAPVAQKKKENKAAQREADQERLQAEYEMHQKASHLT